MRAASGQRGDRPRAGPPSRRALKTPKQRVFSIPYYIRGAENSNSAAVTADGCVGYGLHRPSRNAVFGLLVWLVLSMCFSVYGGSEYETGNVDQNLGTLCSYPASD